MSKPRNSILHLFDPLASPSNAPSPDSDKENSSPTRFNFFGLTHHRSHSSPVKLTRRLVDVGDITVQDHSPHLFLTDDDEHDVLNNDENNSSTLSSSVIATPRPQLTSNVLTTPPNASPRTPFAELPLEHDISPVARSKTYRRSPLPLSSLSDPEHVTPPPQISSTILSVIDEVNTSGTSFASPSPASRLLPLPQDTDNFTLTQETLPGDLVTPQIVVSSADSLSNSVATLNLETPSGSLLTDTLRPFDNTPPSPPSEDPSQLVPNLRPTVLNVSSHNASRHSIDLYSCFQLHLQSDEASFDLLNDRISFFAPGSDAESFLGDDSFDMEIEEANMEKALEKIKSQEEAVNPKTPSPGKQLLPTPTALPDSPLSKDVQLSTPPNPTADVVSDAALPNSARKFLPKRLSLGLTQSPKMSSPRTESAGSPVFVAPLARVELKAPRPSVYTPRPFVRDISSNPPPAVPALKIVKRAKRFDHEKSSSSGSASSSVSSLVPEAIGPALTSISAALNGQKFGSVSSITDLQNRKEGSSLMVTRQSRIVAAAPAPAVAAIRQTGTGPRRVPITEGPGSIVNTAGASATQRALPAIGVVGPKRVPAMTATKKSATVPAQVKMPVAGVLKQPAKHGGGSVSALPRPIVAGTSRLPSSSMRTVGAVDGNGNGGGRNFGVRRMMPGGGKS